MMKRMYGPSYRLMKEEVVKIFRSAFLIDSSEPQRTEQQQDKPCPPPPYTTKSFRRSSRGFALKKKIKTAEHNNGIRNPNGPLVKTARKTNKGNRSRWRMGITASTPTEYILQDSLRARTMNRLMSISIRIVKALTRKRPLVKVIRSPNSWLTASMSPRVHPSITFTIHNAGTKEKSDNSHI